MHKYVDEFCAVPVMCTIHSNEKRFDHQLEALSVKFLGDIPKMNEQPHHKDQSLRILAFNLRDIWDNSDLKEVLLGDDPDRVIKSAIKIEDLEEDVSYTGSDNIFGFVHQLLSKKEFTIKDLLKKPSHVSCKWRAAAANLLQTLILKPLILKSKPTFHNPKKAPVFDNTKSMLETLKPAMILKIARLIKCYFECSVIAAPNTNVDVFQNTMKCSQNFAKVAIKNGFGKHTKINQGLNRNVWNLDGQLLPVSDHPESSDFYLGLDADKIEGEFSMQPFSYVIPDLNRFTTEQFSKLSIEDLDCPEFRYRALNSNLLRHIGEFTFDDLKKLLDQNNQMCERLCAEFKVTTCIEKIWNRYHARGMHPRDDENHHLNLDFEKMAQKRSKPDND